MAEPENCDNRGNIGKINKRENDEKNLTGIERLEQEIGHFLFFTLMMYRVKEGHFKLVKSFVSVRLSQNTNQAMFYPAY